MNRAAIANIENSNRRVTSCVGSGRGEENADPECELGESLKSGPSLS